LIDSQWPEAQAGWIPLRQAVFKFGMTEDDEAASIHDKPFLGLSKDIFEQPDSLHQKLKNREANDAEIAKRATTPFSRRQLTKMLKENSGAHSAEIEPTTLTFSFDFTDPSRRGSTGFGGPPWSILCEPQDMDISAEPLLVAEALSSGVGLVRMGPEEAERSRRERRLIRTATGLVFRQFMLRDFDRAVSTGAALLYARTPGVSAPFRRLPADVWQLLEVSDWHSGTAIAPDSVAFWSIHASGQLATVSNPTKRHTTPDIDNFVRQYVAEENAAGRYPTSRGCERAATEAGIRGHRDRLRDTFKEIQQSAGLDVRRGRRPNSPR
jgi:hypothetical protein